MADETPPPKDEREKTLRALGDGLAAKRNAFEAARDKREMERAERAARREATAAGIAERQATLRAQREARDQPATRIKPALTPADVRRERAPRASRPPSSPSRLGRGFKAAGSTLGRAFAKTRRVRGKVKPDGFEIRSKQVLAACLLPFLFVAGMGITTALFQTVMALLSGIGLSNNVATTMVQIFLGTGLFLSLIYASFKWVQSGGLGILGDT